MRSGAPARILRVVIVLGLAVGGWWQWQRRSSSVTPEPVNGSARQRAAPAVGSAAAVTTNTVSQEVSFPALAEIMGEADQTVALGRYARRVLALPVSSWRDELSALRALPNPARRQELLALLLTRWAASDPAGALAALDKDNLSEIELEGLVLEQWAVAAPAAVATWIESAGSDLAPAERERVKLRRFGVAVAALIQAENFAEAASWLAAQPALEVREGKALVAAWTENDPEAAFNWVLGLTAGRGRVEALRGLVENVAATDPDLATAITRRLSDPAEREGAVAAAVLTEPADGNRTLRPAWLADLVGDNPAGSFDQALMASFRRRSIGAGEEAAARILLAAIRDEGMRRAAAEAYIQSVGSSAPAEAIQAARDHLDEEARAEVVAAIAARWRQQDPVAAEAFLSGP